MATSANYVTLAIDQDVYGLPVEGVREILEFRHVARLPHAPHCVLGMIDLRGQSFPVVDLRLRLGLRPAEPTPATRIVILNATQGGASVGVGLVAERVFEVTGFDDDALEPAPVIGTDMASACVAGVGRRNGRMVVVFDLDRLLRLDDMPDVRAIAAEAA
jgi:purine-binding chemotaxis protein CheW